MQLSDIPFTSRQINVNSVNWSVACTGDENSDKVALLMHGFPDIPETWRHQLPLLIEQGYRVLVPYLPGYGESGLVNSSQYYPGNFAKDIPALLDAMDIEKVTYIGHDWGAYAGWLFAAAAPERVEKLIAVAIPHYTGLIRADAKQVYRSRYILEMALPGSTWLFKRKAMHKLYLLYREWSPDWDIDFNHLQAVKDCLSQHNSLKAALSYYRTSMRQGATDMQLQKLLKAPINIPVLSIAGIKDGCIGVGSFEHQNLGPNADFDSEIILGAGHFCHLERPEAFNPLMMDFLQRDTVKKAA
ncbi:Epoxide hydrolase A [BD1-7 clade bacterium]|uniref:Epoxide hydrolase A n=1 Tax=BD1-7 clade bacterium TaxID=2029982 RepID=A0A5S9PR64_9GAMM|nr:Epoxide hydrolase A [BD1-7 clade bacterium]